MGERVIPDLPPAPYHPPDGFSFPKRPFGKKKIVWRSFQASWLKQWTFLHYDETKDLAYCHICVTAFKQKKMRESRADPVFVSKSMITIKHATISDIHRVFKL